MPCDNTAMAAGRKVAITGGSGLIGGILIDGLADRHQVTGIARRQVDKFDLVMADSTNGSGSKFSSPGGRMSAFKFSGQCFSSASQSASSFLKESFLKELQ